MAEFVSWAQAQPQVGDERAVAVLRVEEVHRRLAEEAGDEVEEATDPY